MKLNFLLCNRYRASDNPQPAMLLGSVAGSGRFPRLESLGRRKGPNYRSQ